VALSGRLLPSYGHKLVKKKNGYFRPKSAPDRPLFNQSSDFKFVWWAPVLPKATVNLKGTGGFQKRPIQVTNSSYNFWYPKFRPKIRNLGPSGH
jgi:hypothetical protein